MTEPVPPSNTKPDALAAQLPTQSSGPQDGTSPSSTGPLPSGVTQLDVGSTLGPYRLEAKLGQGGMGAVYKAVHTKLGKLVAIKVLPAHLIQNAASVARFEREMLAVGALSHPNIVQAHDAGEIGGTHYLAMEYVEGHDLSKLVVDKGPFSVVNACKAVRQTALALSAAHAAGLVHRDIKPSNILVSAKGGQIKLLDLGLALLANEGSQLTELTSAGQTFGTPDYMAPEQWEDAHSADPRTDLYALGCTLFFLLVGRAPFASDKYQNSASKMKGHVIDPIPDLKSVAPHVPDEIVAIYVKLLQKSPADRFQSAAEVALSLAPYTSTKSGSSAPAVSGTSLAAGSSVPQTPVASAIPLTGIAQRSPASGEIPIAPTTELHSPRPGPKDQTGAGRGAGGEGQSNVAQPLVVPPSSGTTPVIPPEGGPTNQSATGFNSDNPLASVQPEPTQPLKTPRRAGSVSPLIRDARVRIAIALAAISLSGVFITIAFNPASGGPQSSDSSLDKGLAKAARKTSFAITSNTNSAENARESGGLRPPLAGVGWHGWPADAPKPAIAPFDAEQAQQHQAAWAKFLNVPVEYTNSIGMKFVLIPPGEFMMGSTATQIETHLKELDRNIPRELDLMKSQGPQHKVILTKALYLGATEVTQAEYKQVMGTNLSGFAAGAHNQDAVAGLDTSRFPVEVVSWFDAAEFCAKLSEKDQLKPFYFRAEESVTHLDGTGYRLPTEAEWEFACRAGTTTRYWTGDTADDAFRVAWISNNAGLRTHPVGELHANPLGLFDIHGNVWEWTEDVMDPSFYNQFANKPAINPLPKSLAQAERVIRGGGWHFPATATGSANRLAHHPSLRTNYLGFRVALGTDAVKQISKRLE